MGQKHKQEDDYSALNIEHSGFRTFRGSIQTLQKPPGKIIGGCIFTTKTILVRNKLIN